MKKVLLLILLVSLIGCSTEIKKQYYPDGKLKAELRYKRGVLEGIGKIFHENGNLKYKVYFQDGKPRTTTCYNENGNEMQCPKLETEDIIK
jgi:antitoxin component YwqK of YwqJK toxin-antitoxin module